MAAAPTASVPAFLPVASITETRMFLRLALCAAMAAVTIVAGAPQPVWAQSPAQNQSQGPAAGPAKPEAKPEAAPAEPAAPQPIDPFGEDVTLVAKPIVYLKGSGTWDNALETITNSFKTLKTYIAKEGLKIDGELMTVFTATDDTGFQYQAAIPIAEPPKNPPKGEIAIGTSPAGHALRFVHRGSYDGLDNTYEAITNYLDDKKLEAKDLFIEQYLTDPLTTNEDHLVVNVYVLIK
jgi:effector-binding domain-containing protein